MKIKYINLDESRDRRTRMDDLIHGHRLTEITERFPAHRTDVALNQLSKSETGCLKSHLELIAGLNEGETTLILEDDVCFENNFSENVRQLHMILEKSDFDIVFLGQTLLFKDAAIHAHQIKILSTRKSKLQKILIDADRFYRYGAFAYMINGKSVSKVKNLLRNTDIQKNNHAIDELLSLWLKSGALKGVITLPYMVGVQADIASTMNDRSNSAEHQIHCDLVNTYLDGQPQNMVDTWRNLLKDNPSHEALAICRAMYTRLTQK